MNVALRKPMTQEEFFVWAEGQEGRYEFDGIQPVAMTGGTNNHGLIAGNLYFQLKSRLRGGPCVPMLPAGGGVATIGNKVRYPEAVVTCSRVPGEERLVPDPVVVFEIISPSSVRTDEVVKLLEYQTVLSIKRYVLIEQREILVTVHSRQYDEPWDATVLAESDVVHMPEIGIEVPVADLYDGIVFDKR